MDDLDRMIKESEKFSSSNLHRKQIEIEDRVKDYEFKNLLDAVEFLFELRAKREKSVKDERLIRIIEDVLKEEPFEYMDEDYILAANKNNTDISIKRNQSR